MKTFLFQSYSITLSKRKNALIQSMVLVFLTKMLKALDRRSAGIGSYWKMLVMISQMTSNAGGRLGSGIIFFVSLLERNEMKQFKNRANSRELLTEPFQFEKVELVIAVLNKLIIPYS
jgi:hypothetical protein